MQYLVFDIETTGLDSYRNDILQMAYLQLDSNLITRQSGCVYFYKDNMHWSKEAENVHHISLESLKPYAADFDVNIRKMFVLLNRANIVGHNVNKFDFPFCRSFLDRNGMPVYKGGETLFDCNSAYDTIEIYRPHTKGSKKLGNVLAEQGVKDALIAAMADKWFGGGNNAHDARWDTTATALLFIKARRLGYI